MQQVFSDTRFTQLDIPAEVLKGIAAAGYEFCTPVQKEVLPQTLKGDNIAAQSQTGTGKTATFLITLLTRLVRTPARNESSRAQTGTSRPRALILAPTRELAIQIGEEAATLAQPCGLNFQAIYGGVDYEKQRLALQYEQVDVVVATPGRLIDYMKQKVIFLDDIEVLVIDEADRMFDMGFIPDVRWLLKRCPATDKRQSLLFSATLSEKVMELAYEHLDISTATSINPDQITVDKIKQSLYHVGKHEKMSLLFGLLQREQPERSLIFTNTKRMAEILEEYLKANGFAAACLTGDVPQKKRQATLERFKNQKLNILIATDVASRGLHIEAVTHVFNYDLPQDAEDYVHRIGRTARIGATGIAIALAGEEDAFYLEAIEKLAGKIPVIWAEDEDFVKDFKRPSPRSAGSRARTPVRGKTGESRSSRTTAPTRKKPSRSGSAKSESCESRPAADVRPDKSRPAAPAAASAGKNETPSSAGKRPRRRPQRQRNPDKSNDSSHNNSLGDSKGSHPHPATPPRVPADKPKNRHRPPAPPAETPAPEKQPLKKQPQEMQPEKERKGILKKIVSFFQSGKK
ncbi:MAG: DEAD/DEAH box helicase [Deltaproteobacteria bacterium]|nr:DEAD/DEAH box helicase [Deltaproteobacteria bacterium]